jgi:hypothetical protein
MENDFNSLTTTLLQSIEIEGSLWHSMFIDKTKFGYLDRLLLALRMKSVYMLKVGLNDIKWMLDSDSDHMNEVTNLLRSNGFNVEDLLG